MKKLLFAGVAAGMLALAVPAQAHPNYHYEGGCGFATLSDGGEDDQTTWTGSVQAAVVATDAAGIPSPTTSISVECRAYKNGVYQGVIASASGTGAAATASEYVYQAAPDDVITVCDVVTVGGEVHTDCGDATTTPIVPEPVQEAIETVFNEVNNVLIQIDPTICPVIAALAPGVAGVLDITSEGDVYIAGEFFWDCPPYAA